MAGPLRLVPFATQQAALEVGLNHGFRSALADGDLDFLEGRSIALEIGDLGWRWPITLDEGRLRVREKENPAHATIRGTAFDFLEMASGSADPDTLFFQRRLTLDGDTELGLELKNFLDGTDSAELPAIVRAARGLLRLCLGPVNHSFVGPGA
ncbi:MAG TPA: SCP2 sterol-binding domain-containing protein [Woeseiaceae bacterium]|jgi:predicted lipid carrier protein YhbT|nr:SCP2 sterol-binding domain-containing protein [Woeseiaceae bacterium]